MGIMLFLCPRWGFRCGPFHFPKGMERLPTRRRERARVRQIPGPPGTPLQKE